MTELKDVNSEEAKLPEAKKRVSIFETENIYSVRASQSGCEMRHEAKNVTDSN